MLNITLITCPDDCADVNLLPAIGADQDCTGYTQGLSQVCDLYIVPSGAGDIFDAWEDPLVATAASVSNTTADNTKAHWFVGEGGVAEPEETIDEYPKLKRKISERLFTLTFRIKNLVQAQYDALRQFQCGDTSFTFYYGDLADYVYGVDGGLSPESVDVDFPKGGGNTDKNVAIITLTFLSVTDPDRFANPHPETA